MHFNPLLENIKNYEPGKDIERIAEEYGVSEVIKLASNENPLGVSPRVLEAIRQNAHLAHLYPDDSMRELKCKLSKHYKVHENELIIGAGSDQIIEYAVRAKLCPQSAYLQCGVSFAMYEIYAKQVGAKIYKTQHITHHLEELKSLYNRHKKEIKIVFLCVPNNPLGECLFSWEVEEFVSIVDEDCLVIIDGAYNEFAGYKDELKRLRPAHLVQKFSNVLYLGTFSKLYALGGLRIGYGIARKDIIQALYKLRAPFNVTYLSLKAASAALDDVEFVQKTLENNFAQMQKYEQFAQKNSIKTIESYTNFIGYFFDTKNSTQLCEKLLKAGIIIRDLKAYGLNAVRISMGTTYENERFFTEFEKIFNQA